MKKAIFISLFLLVLVCISIGFSATISALSTEQQPVDIGLRIYDGINIQKIAAEPLGTSSSPLRFAKTSASGIVIYGIVLLDPSHPCASKFRVITKTGIKAFGKYCPTICEQRGGICINDTMPYCSGAGSKSEGWYKQSWGSIVYDTGCSNCIAVCKNIGTSNEGWYTSTSCTSYLSTNSAGFIKKETCSDYATQCPSGYNTYSTGCSVVSQKCCIPQNQPNLSKQSLCENNGGLCMASLATCPTNYISYGLCQDLSQKCCAPRNAVPANLATTCSSSTDYSSDITSIITTSYSGIPITNQESSKAFDNNTATNASVWNTIMCYAPPCPQPPVYIGQNFTQPKKIQKIRLYTTTTINAVVRYSDDANNWNDTNIILINKLPSTSWYEFCLPDFGAHKYWVLWSIGRLSVNEMEMMETSQIAQSQQTPLVLNASMPSTGKKDVAVTFNAQASGGAPPYTYQWDFDDGQFSSEQNPQHIFTAYNEYTVRVLVTDSSNSSAKASQIIGILPF